MTIKYYIAVIFLLYFVTKTNIRFKGKIQVSEVFRNFLAVFDVILPYLQLRFHFFWVGGILQGGGSDLF